MTISGALRFGLPLTLIGIAAACSSPDTTTPPPPVADAGPPDAAPEAGPPPPPRICKTPAPPTGPWFKLATAEFGLQKTASVEPQAVSVIAADLDGDGWVDLLAQQGVSARGAVNGEQGRFVYLNRPSPKDPAARVFVDTAAMAGLSQTRDGKGDRGYGLVNIGDLNNDGSPDVVLCPAEPFTTTENVQDPCDAFLNDGKAHFTLAPASDLGAKVFWVGSAALLDYDRDGVLDFWPATIAHWPYPTTPPVPNQPPTLFRGNGDGTFKNVSADVGLPAKDGAASKGTQWRHVFGVTACDLDGDGDDDMLFADYGRQENQVWRNDGGHFTNVAHELGLDYDDRADYSDDQSYLCYCKVTGACTPAPADPVVDCNVFGNPYFRGWLPGLSDKPWALGGNNFTFACGDIDDDGDLDLMSATITHGDVGSSSDPSELILNPGDGSKFTRPGNDKTGLDRPEMGVYWNHGDNSIVFADLDLDGRKDIFMTDTGAYGPDSRSWLWHQKADGTFEEVTQASGLVDKNHKPDLQGPAFVDIDGDGDLDLVVGDVAGLPLRVYKNLVGQDQNWLRVKLAGKGAGGANASAIGARVRVTAGGRTQTLELQGGYGHGNLQNDLVLTFGLGSACDVDAVEVRWPDGAATVATYKDVRANYTITIHEGDAEVGYPEGAAHM